MTVKTDPPIHPAPQHVLRQADEADAPARRVIVSEADQQPATRFFEAAGLNVSVESAAAPLGEVSDPGALHAAIEAADESPDEAFRLRFDGDALRLESLSEHGCLAGLQASWPLLESGEPLPRFDVLDWPAVHRRAFQLDLARQPESVDEVKRLIRQAARYRYNECQLYLENSIKLAAFGDAADPDGLSIDAFKAIQKLGRDLGLDVVPSLNVLGHMEKLFEHESFAPLKELAHGPRHPEQPIDHDMCPELDESRQLAADIIDEICRISDSPRVMVGLDECWTLGSHPRSREKLDAANGAGPLFRDWIHFLHERVAAHGKTMWMWEDMLFYHLGALADLPRDIGMQEWHYQHIESVPHYSFQNWRRIDALRELRGRGHPVMLCCGPNAHHLESMLRYADGQTLDGVLVVQWEGSKSLQEEHHLGRAMSGQLLWRGVTPEPARVAASVTGAPASSEPMQRAGDLIARTWALPRTNRGGSATCPRFWSWPDNARARLVWRNLLRAWDRDAPAHEAFEVARLFLARRYAHVLADWARENAALAGRQMLQANRTRSAPLSAAADELEEAATLSKALAATARRLHDRYAASITPRKMLSQFDQQAQQQRELLSALRAFVAQPDAAHWPFAPVSVHLDGIVLDPCAHRVALHVEDANGSWQQIHNGPATLSPALEGEFVMSFALEQMPRRVQLEVGGFASVAVRQVRIETLDGTWLPGRVEAAQGVAEQTEHLLTFDQKVALFNAPDVRSNWLSLTPPTVNSVQLVFGDEKQPGTAMPQVETTSAAP